MHGLSVALTFWSQPQVVTDSWVELASTVTLITLLVGAYRHFECHVSGCHRPGRFSHGHYKLCHVHHPAVPSSGRITLADIAKVQMAATGQASGATGAAGETGQASGATGQVPGAERDQPPAG